MQSATSRRAALRLSGVALVSALAGCSQSVPGDDGTAGDDSGASGSGGGSPDSFDLRVENRTATAHDLAIIIQTEFGEEVFFEETFEIGGNAERTFEDVITEKKEQVISVSMDAAIEGNADRLRKDELNDTIRIHPGTDSAPPDGVVRLLIRKLFVKGPSEKQPVVDLTYEGRPTETDF